MKDFYDAKYCDIHGNYTLEYRKRVLVADVSGAVGPVLARRFSIDVARIVNEIQDEHWAYLGKLNNYMGVTEEARKITMDCHTACRNSGCVVDAYIINIAMAADQLAQTRKMVNIEPALSDQIFTREEDAITFINQVLAKVDAKVKKEKP